MQDHHVERLHALDAIRGYALLLGIVFHATMSFIPIYSGLLWPVHDLHRSDALSLTFYVLHTFRMMLFFIVAGFFGRLSLGVKGRRPWLIDRLKRIGLPLLISWPIAWALCSGIYIWGATVMRSENNFRRHLWSGLPEVPFLHLWFLYILLLFYVIWLGTIALADCYPLARDRCAAWLDRLAASSVRHPAGVLLLAAPMTLALWLTPRWRMWFGIVTPDRSLVPPVSSFFIYALAFGLGWFLHRQRDLLDTWRRRWLPNLAMALLFTALSLWIVGLKARSIPVYDDTAKAWYAASYALASWFWCYALMGLALRYLDHNSATRRYIADSSYWLYLVHLPIVMALQVAVASLDWPWWIKFGIIMTAGLGLMFASYQYVIRYSLVGTFLNGKRHREPAHRIMYESSSRAAAPHGTQQQ